MAAEFYTYLQEYKKFWCRKENPQLQYTYTTKLQKSGHQAFSADLVMIIKVVYTEVAVSFFTAFSNITLLIQ